MSRAFLYAMAATLTAPAAATLWMNHAQLCKNPFRVFARWNFREISREYSDHIGIVDSDRLNEFESREINRQLDWKQRPWKRLFEPPPHVNWSGIYGRAKTGPD
jgi:hypothetical protein